MNEPELQASLGAKVRSRREALRLTRQQVSSETGMSPSFLADIEAGQKNPSFLTLFKLARALRISVSELVDVESAPAQVDLGKRIASLARRSSQAEISRFVELAEWYFRAPAKGAAKKKTRRSR